MQCNSMDKNVDKNSAVECTSAQPRLTKSPEEEEKYFSFCISVSISIGQEIRCVPYAGFFFNASRLPSPLKITYFAVFGPFGCF